MSRATAAVTAPPRHSEYIVYVDESGDHGLSNIDPSFPVFVLAFCIFQKDVYCDAVVPAVQRLKFKHFGHDQAILHEREIRRGIGDFRILNSAGRKAAFMDDVTTTVANAEFTLIAAVIDKGRYATKYDSADNCYHMALQFGLERLYYYLRALNQLGSETCVVVERRGKREDGQLELEFRRICDGGNYHNRRLPFRIVSTAKQANSVGLQFADLVARPIGTHVLHPEQSNRAFDAFSNKFYSRSNGDIKGYGLKRFP